MTLLQVILGFSVVLYFGIKYLYSYWRRNGFPEIKPSIPFGNLTSFIKQETSFGVNVCDLYWVTKERVAGIYFFFKPVLMIRDATLAKRIMTTDFEHFHDRGVLYSPDVDPATAQLFTMPGKVWKDLRVTMTPLFTAGKLRSMFSILLNSGNQLSNHIENKLGEGQDVFEMKDLFYRYVLNSIASVFWGLDIDTIENPDHPFRQIGKLINAEDFVNKLKSAIVFLYPQVFEMTKVRGFPNELYEFFDEFLGKNIQYRENTGVQRNDFLQLMLELKKQNKIKYNEILGNVFLFYGAGSETSSALASFCLHELCRNSKIMAKVVADIDTVLAEHKGEINYDSIKDMKYLDFCTKETLRKVPGLPILNRICMKDYKIPDSDLVIKKGTAIVLPLLGYHNDPQYFPDPDSFIPERFDESPDNPIRYNHDAYFPFGDGPRACIAVRMGVMVAKTALVYVLSKFKCEATSTEKIQFDNFSVGLMPKGGINIRFVKR